MSEILYGCMSSESGRLQAEKVQLALGMGCLRDVVFPSVEVNRPGTFTPGTGKLGIDTQASFSRGFFGYFGVHTEDELYILLQERTPQVTTTKYSLDKLASQHPERFSIINERIDAYFPKPVVVSFEPFTAVDQA
ncbi:MAG: hypothetical protein M3Q79_00340 [bacterium]|nr:hypothetical protein [bacterium]